MFIAHVRFYVAAENRDQALKTLMNGIETVRAMKGCHAFIPFLDPSDPQGIGILHEWSTSENFAAYTNSTAFAETGRVVRPLMVTPPVSRRFDAALLESIN